MRVVGMLALGSLAGAGCSCESGAGGPPGRGCKSDADCPAGETCMAGKCEALADGGEKGSPDIAVAPLLLDFASPLLGVAVTLSVRVANTGDGTLVVDPPLVEGDEPPLDYFVAKDAKDGFTLGPGDSREIAVTLVWTDDEPPVATLHLLSNDPDEASVAVELVSEWKGDPLLVACVLAIGTDPFAKGACADPVEIDFGTVPFGADADRLVAVWNYVDGGGNAQLDLESAAVTDEAGFGALFEVADLFQLDGADEDPVALPFSLNPGDAATPPDVLYARVRFSADVSGVLAEGESLRFAWDGGPTDVPLRARATCEDGYVDLDGDPANLCECGPMVAEVCNDIDDDCDGATDEDLALGTACDGELDDDLCPEGALVCAADETTECDDVTGESWDLCAPGVWARPHAPGGGGATTVAAATLADSTGLEGPGGVAASGAATLRDGFWFAQP